MLEHLFLIFIQTTLSRLLVKWLPESRSGFTVKIYTFLFNGEVNYEDCVYANFWELDYIEWQGKILFARMASIRLKWSFFSDGLLTPVNIV